MSLMIMQGCHVPCELNLCFLGKLFNANNSKSTTVLWETCESKKVVKLRLCPIFLQCYTELLGLERRKPVVLLFSFVGTLSVWAVRG